MIKKRLKLLVFKLLSIKILVGLPLVTALLWFEKIDPWTWFACFVLLMASREVVKILFSNIRGGA